MVEKRRSIVLILNNDNCIIIVRMNMEEKRSIVLTLNNDNYIIIV